MNIGFRIRELRKSRKYTINALAENIGIRRESLSNLERNVNAPSLQTLKKICDELNVTLAEFFSFENDILTPQHKKLLKNIDALSAEQLKLLNDFLVFIKEKNNLS
jgi:transcriptional regulator with XRE-family HTH domain